MKALEAWTLEYLLNSLWQAPVIFFAGWIAAKLADKAGPKVVHRIWVTALLAEAILPACQVHPGTAWKALWSLLLPRSTGTGGQVRVIVGPIITHETNIFRFPPYIVTLFLIAYLAVLLYFITRFVWGFVKTRSIRNQAEPVILEGVQAQRWSRLSYGLPTTTQIAISPMTPGPITVGVRSPVLILPFRFLEEIGTGELDALLAHEFAHIRRRDFAKNLLYNLVSLLVTYHPFIWMTRARIAETRELVCDAMAAEAISGRESYARSLLRLATMMSDQQPITALNAIGIFDANNFERRIMSLTRKPVELAGARRLIVLTACALIVLAACASAIALRMDVNTPQDQQSASHAIKVDYNKLKLLHHETPVYPAEAKANHDTVDGMVLLVVTIGKDGAPIGIHVGKSLRNDYDTAAIDAVKNWRWQPYLLNGNPVVVDTELRVLFSMGSEK